MLLAGLHGQAQGRLAEAVDGHADQTPGHVALEAVAGGEERRVRAAKTQRHAKTLGTAQDHVGTEFTRRGQQGQGQQVGGHRHQRAGGMGVLHQSPMVDDSTSAGRVLQQQAEITLQALVQQCRLIADDHFNTQRLGTGAQHVEGLRMTMVGDEKRRGLALRQTLAEGHGFGGGGGFIEQRGVGDRQAGEVADQGLEIQQRFQAALGNFWLVRGVGGVPGRVFQQVAQDRCRGMAVVVTLADEALEQLVVGGDGFERSQGVGFALPVAQFQYAGALDAVRNNRSAHGLQGVEAEGREHLLLVTLAWADMTGNEFVSSAEVDGHGESSGVSVGGDQAVVGVLVEQPLNGASVGRNETEEPAFTQRVFVDQLRAVFELVIDGDHFTAQGHVHAAGRFYRLNGGGFGALVVAFQLWQLHVDHITQGVLGEGGNPDGDAAVSFSTQPFVIFGKTQLAHGNSSRVGVAQVRH
ncbi:hypothetical protein D3C81_964730 [compost metagenome]